MKLFINDRSLLETGLCKPLFLYKSGIVLSRKLFVDNTRLYLSMIGVDPARYTGHSYRVGGATCAAASGMADWEIKMLGRWSSDAYLRYIKTPISTQIGFAKCMTKIDNHSLFFRNLPYTPH
jgi:hypothetical protein